MSHDQEEEIRQKLLLADEDLLAEIGASLGKGATFTDTIKRGRHVFENLQESLKERICTSPAVVHSFNTSKRDDAQAIAAIVDCIASALFGVPPPT